MEKSALEFPGMGNECCKIKELDVRKLQIQTTVRYHFIPMRIIFIKKRKKKEIMSIGKDAEK